MTRYVLVEVDNNDSADALVTKLGKVRGMRVAGLFGVPTKYCDCPKDDGYHQGRDIVRGAKLGWWVHYKCRRARRGTHQLENLIAPDQREYDKIVGSVNVVTSVSICDIPRQNF